jgi:lactoylglutathione lyase
VKSRDEVDRLCTLAADEHCLLRAAQDYGPPVGYWALIRDPDGHTLEIAHGQEVAFSIDKVADAANFDRPAPSANASSDAP